MRLSKALAPWLGLIAGSFIVPIVVLAAYNDVTVDNEGITINLPTPNKNYTLTRATNVQSFDVNGTYIEFVMLSGSILELQSSDKNKFTLSGGCSILEQKCESDKSTISVQCNSSETIKITPDTVNLCSGTSSGSSSGSGAGASAGASQGTTPTTPVEPGVVSKTTVTISVAVSVTVNLGSSSHQVTVSTASDTAVTLTIKSNPITLTLAKDEFKEVDSNGDGKVDLRVTYLGLVGGRPQLVFRELAASAQTPVTPVTPVTPGTPTLPAAPVAGATASCGLSTDMAYKKSGSSAVYYVTASCTKRPFVNSRVFFSYFDKWSDVSQTTKTKLDAVGDDKLGFLPWGPKFDPQYGALAKITSDPKVYLLLGGDKYWINSEAVFNALGYKWNWIEDIDPRLLDKYKVGSEISYTDHHPNFTLVKYTGDAKVYRLEPDPADASKQVRRHIKDEKTFKSLKYRWDRIVSLPASERYNDGAQLTSN